MARKQAADPVDRAFETIRRIYEQLSDTDCDRLDRRLFRERWFLPHVKDNNLYLWMDAVVANGKIVGLTREVEDEKRKGRRRHEDMTPEGSETINALVVRLRDDESMTFPMISEYLHKLTGIKTTPDAVEKRYSRENKRRGDGTV